MAKQKDKVYAFIDSQNLHKGTQAAGWSLDYARFRTYLRTKYNVQKAFLFIGYIPSNASLYARLQRVGYILVFKPILEVKKGKEKIIKGNVDAELVLHAMIEKENYGKAIIVSGDGDFHCLVEHLEEEGKLSKILTPNTHYSSLLKKYSKYVLPIGTIRDKVKRS